jgi:hypothetical protein
MRTGTITFADSMPDNSVVQRPRRKDSCLALETATAIGISREALRQYLESDVSIQPHVAGPEHFAHRPRADEADHLVGP